MIQILGSSDFVGTIPCLQNFSVQCQNFSVQCQPQGSRALPTLLREANAREVVSLILQLSRIEMASDPSLGTKVDVNIK